MSAESVSSILAAMWSGAGGQPEALDRITLTGAEPALPSSFRVGALAQATIAASGLAAAEIWRQRTGREQEVSVDMRHAAVLFRSERYAHIDGNPPGPTWDRIAGVYSTGDGRKVRLHTNFPHHRDGILKLLDCEYDREAVAAALQKWTGAEFETRAAEAGLVATLMRTPEEWAAHPQGQAIARLPLVDIQKIGEAPPLSLSADPQQPLSGVRVADLTRVIAGPVAGRTLAAHGADVMRITSPKLPGLPNLDFDTGRGKLSASLDLNDADDRARFSALIKDANVLIDGYRPGAIGGKGFSAETCAELRPGIVVVDLSAYGHEGPWATRRGFDSLVQNGTGINYAEAEAMGVAPPKELPAQALDHGAGYLLATGAMLALARQAQEGGSWRVRVSLAGVGHHLTSLGRLPQGFDAPDPTFDDIPDLVDDIEGPAGRHTFVRHAAILSETPAQWTRPPVPLGTSPAEWP